MAIFNFRIRRIFNYSNSSRAQSIAAASQINFNSLPKRGLSKMPEKFGGDDSMLPVLIVGAGPVGLVLSIILTKLGIRCAILEKNRTFTNHPQAHFINNRSMEVFRKLDGLAHEIQEFQPPVDLWRKFVYCTSLSGSVLGEVDHMQPQDFGQVVSPVSVAHFSQYKLTRLLLKKLEHLNFHVHDCEGLDPERSLREREIWMGHEFYSINTTDHYINVTATFQKDGRQMERNIQCGYLIGADGAGSTMRKLAGIDMKGERELQKLVSVHFMSRNVGQYLLSKRPGMLFFIFNTEAIGVLVAHDLKQGEFILQVPFYPPQQKLEDFNPEICQQLILKLVGRELQDVDVVDIKPWVMHAEVAEKFMSCNGRILLAGDAAHRFPPAGGFGMNTGIQDAHNLAWKLAAVVKGIAPAALLHTYETERRPIAVFNTELSVQNFRAAMAVPAALGLDPTVANSVHRAINDGIGSVLPAGLQSAVLNGLFAMGRAQLSEGFLNESNPIGSTRLARLKQIFEEGKSLQLQFPAEDLGFRYLKGALVHETESAHKTADAPTGRRRDYVPSAEPGSRLPHMKVRVLLDVLSEETISTLDLISGDKLEFLLIIAPVPSSYDIAHAALEVAHKFNVLVKVCIIWPEHTNNNVIRNAGLFESRVDVIEVKKSSTSPSPSWWDLCKMSDRGAILVRPDEHIAWRSRFGIVGDPVVEMEKVFCVVLGFV